MIVIGKWKLKDADTSRVLQLLPELADKTRTEKGNLSYTVYQSEDDPGELILLEEYVDAVAVEAHQHSEHYRRIVVTEVIPHLESREVIVVKKLI